MSVLSVNNIGKAFRTYRSEWQRFGRWFGLSLKPTEETWVLHHINFDIQSGEAIGIVGQNGAGKSTLLKIITGTLKQTVGQVHINGRIAAILELGMGFNPDLSGRQNIRHAAGLMGFTPDQIDQAMTDIEVFAEIGEYFDEPIRTYSSGMQMRAAFAVATAWRPEVLIIDEALSVGDTYFQHKSFARIREFRDQGTTLFIVSHDRSAIQTLCDRAILLEKGTIIKDGDPEEVFDFYNALIAEKKNSTVKIKKVSQAKIQTTSGTKEASVVNVQLQNSHGEAVEYISVGDDFILTVDVKINQSIDFLVLGYAIKDRLGQVMYGTNTWHTKQILANIKEGECYRFNITLPANFGVGSYSVSIALHERDTHLTKNYDWHDRVLVFNVINQSKEIFQGSVWLPQTTKVMKLKSLSDHG